jgi:hypothetical protein
VLPFKPLVYLLPFFTLTLFILVVAAERVDRRFWCRALCPLGAIVRADRPFFPAAAAAYGVVQGLRRLC